MCLYQVIITLHFLNKVVNDIESTRNSIMTSLVASLKSESTCKLINRIPGPLLLISSLPGSASIMQNRSANLAMSKSFLKALPGKLNIKDTHLVFSICMYVVGSQVD